MMQSFEDELAKIAANAALQSTSANLVARPASVSQGSNVNRQTISTSAKPTNYTMINTQPASAPVNTTAGSKSVATPQVRT